MEEYKQYKTEALQKIAWKLGIRGYYNNSKPKLIELIMKHKKLQETDFKVDTPTFSIMKKHVEEDEKDLDSVSDTNLSVVLKKLNQRKMYRNKIIHVHQMLIYTRKT